MSTKQIRSLSQLDPVFRGYLKAFLADMATIDPMEAHETFRTDERQAMLLSDGSSKATRSKHQDGLAADIHFTTGEAFPKAKDKRWMKAAEISEKYGISNGGLLWGWDWNHFEWNQEPASSWEKTAIAWAVKNKVSNGERPRDEITRVECMEMIRKYDK